MGQNARKPAATVVISGYYGFGNSGDEAVLQAILLALEAEAAAAGMAIEPLVLSIRPEQTARMYGVRAAHRMRPAEVLSALRGADGLISGGGSLLQDVTSANTIPYYAGILKLAQWLRKPTFIYAQGVGPVRRAWMHPLIRSVMRGSTYISVRDAESARYLQRLGIAEGRVDVVPDPVMGLTPLGELESGQSEPESGMPVLGVSVRYWRSDREELRRIAAALGALARRRKLRLRFLPFHLPDDAAASSEVMERLGELGESVAELAQPQDNPRRMLAEVSRCDALLGMRLHALIYAAGAEVPMLGVSYDPKIDQFLARLDLEAVGTTEALDAGALADAAEAMLSDAEGWRMRHRDTIDHMKAEARRPARRVVELLQEQIKR
ncbi:polysaccharide pyruvyl transferase CsaB [Paenibacillus sp. IB182496]|uniref:Polysaccharide pyruvyl transferase CsaB n=1 Tax=Paenibacillus sabuli TaxID=2772509 RepID=A0A927BT75_9BACL|nr:polysaccharide pyruvyl transferase CsaB [Paenibacillus sabuli]MBD2845857.1 polysaccharide pyruvyl transferase CsaB [Paenibacillus sabuli]